MHNYGRKIIGEKNAYCHQTVAKAAQGMAGAVYDELAKHNEWYERNPSREAYVGASWGLYVAQARQTLAGMLSPHSTIPEEAKYQVYEALCLDNELRMGRSGEGIQVSFH